MWNFTLTSRPPPIYSIESQARVIHLRRSMMKSLPVRLPAIPADTARAASSLFGKGNIYIRVGEHVEELFYELPPLEMEIHGRSFPQANARYALMTAFQFAEQLTDRQMVEALHNRVDLKYALHLPTSYSTIDPLTLCEFRKRLTAEPANMQTFRMLIDRLSEFGLLKICGEQPLETEQILDEICTSNRLENVMEAMYQALETLAVTNAEWLRTITLPHWFQRYNRQGNLHYWPNSAGVWKETILEVASDIRYLLGEIDGSGLSKLTSLREVQHLRHTWEEQFVADTDKAASTHGLQWRPTCAFH